MHSLRRATLLLLTLPGLAAAQAAPSAAGVARVTDSVARAFLADGRSPSVAIAIHRGDSALVVNAWGTADLEHDVPATVRSVYRIGSVTKQFTAAAVMQLVEAGQVALADSIGAHLPALPVAWRGVTVHQLLNHTSGIPSYTDLGPEWYRRWGEEMTPAEIVALTADQPMTFAPGTAFRYNNTGYVLLGMLIEQVSGRSWGEDLEERFTKPLGLTATSNCLAGPVVPHRARGYDRQRDGWANTQYLAMTQPYAAGAVCSTLGDLARWNRALHTGQVVPRAAYLLMVTPTAPAATYGFGLARATAGDHPVITHGGGIHGFATANAWVPERELSVTVLANSGSAQVEDLLGQLLRASLGLPLLTGPPTVAISHLERARYVGVYTLELPGGATDLTVAEAGEHLTGRLAGQAPVPLIHFGDHTFGADFDPALRLTFAVEEGRAVRLTLLQGGGRFEGARKPD